MSENLEGNASTADAPRSRARFASPSQRSRYGDAFQVNQTPANNPYQRLQQEAAQKPSAFQQQAGDVVLPSVSASFAPVAGSAAVDYQVVSLDGSSQPQRRNSLDFDAPKRNSLDFDAPKGSARGGASGSASTRRSSLRRETVSPIGYEPGQMGRPSGLIDQAALEEDMSSGLAGTGRSSWNSNSSKPIFAKKSKAPTVIAFVLVVLVLLVIVLALLGAFNGAA
ncbi:MAG: hypothetical protein Q4E12_07675 [Coriobacteriia bacterium]|nr:hypothetical protein [Coriobacteriia bacterium]